MNGEPPASLVALAGQEAERFHGAGPAAAWQPRARSRPRVAAIAAVGLTTLVAMYALLWRGTAAAPQPTLVPAGPAAGVHPAGLWAEPSPSAAAAAVEVAPLASEATAIPTAGEAATARAAPSAALTVMRRGAEIAIDAVAASRSEAARELSRATGAPVDGEAALAGAPPLTIHLRTRDANDAWQAVLGPYASHALHCGARGCKVWLVRSGVHSAAPAAPPPAAAGLPGLVEYAGERVSRGAIAGEGVAEHAVGRDRNVGRALEPPVVAASPEGEGSN